MAKSLEHYRDESRREFGEVDIEAAFPIWLVDIDDKRRVSIVELLGIAVMSILGVFGVILAFASNLVVSMLAYARGQTRKREPTERREVDHDVTHGHIVFRPNHIHVHEVREKMRPGGRLADIDEHTVVRMGPDDSGLRRTIIDVGGARWSLRPTHEASLRERFAARGIRVEPLAD